MYGGEWAGSWTGAWRSDVAIAREFLEESGVVSRTTTSMTWDEIKGYVRGLMSRD